MAQSSTLSLLVLCSTSTTGGSRPAESIQLAMKLLSALVHEWPQSDIHADAVLNFVNRGAVLLPTSVKLLRCRIGTATIGSLDSRCLPESEPTTPQLRFMVFHP